jgi:hypothetical protein
MNFEINLEDYVSKDEIKEVILSEIRQFTNKQTENTMKRIFSNGAYEILSQCVEDSIKSQHLDFLKSEVSRLLTDKSSINYALFKQPNHFDTNQCTVARVFADCVSTRSTEIAAAVDKALHGLNAKDFKQFLIRYAVKDK